MTYIHSAINQNVRCCQKTLKLKTSDLMEHITKTGTTSANYKFQEKVNALFFFPDIHRLIPESQISKT